MASSCRYTVPPPSPATATHFVIRSQSLFQTPNANDTVFCFPVLRLLSSCKPLFTTYATQMRQPVYYATLSIAYSKNRSNSCNNVFHTYDPSLLLRAPTRAYEVGPTAVDGRLCIAQNRDSPPATARVLSGLLVPVNGASLSLVPETNEGSPSRVPIHPSLAFLPQQEPTSYLVLRRSS